jgi:purine-nucleoside/S-methyl-5'-thioadenosine phosphorylase / adenosine deaminase
LLRKDDRHIYRASVLEQFPWVEHGFGTRDSGDWTSGATTVKQIHSDIVLKADVSRGCLGQGDALVTDQPGTLLAIRTADCIPILLADEHKKVVAAIHAGWRGTASGIVRRAVEALHRHFGTRPDDIWAAIGPGIGGCCYEVGPEVVEQLRPLFAERTDWDAPPVRVNLPEANRRHLIMAGVSVDRIVTADACTFCRPDDFYSWRRDQTTGRMVSAIGIRL